MVHRLSLHGPAHAESGAQRVAEFLDADGAVVRTVLQRMAQHGRIVVGNGYRVDDAALHFAKLRDEPAVVVQSSGR